MDRRTFLKKTVVGAGVAVGLSKLNLTALGAEEPTVSKKEAVLKLCSQDGLVPGGSIKEKAANIIKYGGCGLEFGGIDVKRAEQIKKDLEGTGVGPAALCWGSHNGDFVSMDLDKRKKAMEDLDKVLQAAGALGGTGVIWVPCFNGQSKLKPEELDKVMEEILPQMADLGKKAGSRVIIEPLNKGETFYINRIEQAAAWCNKINSPGLCLMGDFYHMSKEEKDQEQAFVSGGKWVHHVHLATGKSRILPSQEPHSYVEGFKGLKRIGYQDYCSLECGIKGTKETTDDKGKTKMVSEPDIEIPKGFAFLKQQWEEAKI